MRERIRKKLVMPEVLGLRWRDAQIMLTNQGFAPARVRYVQSYEPPGHVVQQHPARGQLINSDSETWLHVSKRSYVQYLPQIYQVEAATGNSFIREFLWVFQHIFDSINGKLDQGHQYYDPQETPEEFLPWLASWVALVLDIDWPTVKKRKMIKKASEMYRYRGTQRAMVEVLEIFIGKRPRIEENAWPYAGFRVGVSSTVAEDTIILPAIDLDHTFMVHIPIAPEDITEEMVVKVHNIIKMEKPAHTTYFLQFKTEDVKAKPQLFMQIGVSALGVADVRYDDEPEVGPEPSPVAAVVTSDAESPTASDRGAAATMPAKTPKKATRKKPRAKAKKTKDKSSKAKTSSTKKKSE